MDNLPPAIFLIPVIALIVSVSVYFVLKKAAPNKITFTRYIFTVLVLAFLLNFAWEVLQMPLYKMDAYNLKSITFCASAAVADAIMVLLLFMCFALFYSKPLLVRLTSSTVLLMMLAGVIGAIVVEKYYVSSGNWTYTESMPIIPLINVGLSPILQFMVLPVLIYYLSFQLLKR